MYVGHMKRIGHYYVPHSSRGGAAFTEGSIDDKAAMALLNSVEFNLNMGDYRTAQLRLTEVEKYLIQQRVLDPSSNAIDSSPGKLERILTRYEELNVMYNDLMHQKIK
jgi:hypothetical protein